MSLTQTIKSARRVSTPLIAVQTADQFATIETICTTLETDCVTTSGDAPKIKWDIMNGLKGINQAGKNVIPSLVDPSMIDSIQAISSNPAEALGLCAKLPEGSAVFYCNAHRFIDNEAVAQAIGNLRDAYKNDHRTLYLLAPQITLPSELAQDVMVIDEELPDDDALTAIINSLFAAVQRPEPNSEYLEMLLPALRGLAAFPAEQSLAMSLTPDGVDIPGLWERKRLMVEQTPGLHFVHGGATLDEIGGEDQLKGLLTRLFNGPKPPKLVVFVDEVEKSVGGAAGPIGDSSGVAQDQVGTMLKGFDDLEATGILLVGPPGTGKSSLAKATAATFGVPAVFADFGGAKAGIVGSSEANIRQIFKVLKALAGKGGALFIATSNRLESVPPELQRRLGKFGVWMVDMPTPAERGAIWPISANRWGIDLATALIPRDDDWTGADIANCCELAHRLAISPAEAAIYLSPVAKSSPDAVKRIRGAAHNRFLSAAHPGAYMMPDADAAVPFTGRAITLGG